MDTRHVCLADNDRVGLYPTPTTVFLQVSTEKPVQFLSPVTCHTIWLLVNALQIYHLNMCFYKTKEFILNLTTRKHRQIYEASKIHCSQWMFDGVVHVPSFPILVLKHLYLLFIIKVSRICLMLSGSTPFKLVMLTVIAWLHERMAAVTYTT